MENKFSIPVEGLDFDTEFLSESGTEGSVPRFVAPPPVLSEEEKLRAFVVLPAAHPEAKRKRGPRYTPVSRRQDKPDAIAWLVRNHPELTDAEIGVADSTPRVAVTPFRGYRHEPQHRL